MLKDDCNMTARHGAKSKGYWFLSRSNARVVYVTMHRRRRLRRRSVFHRSAASDGCNKRSRSVDAAIPLGVAYNVVLDNLVNRVFDSDLFNLLPTFVIDHNFVLIEFVFRLFPCCRPRH
jgi:hypothetical protein